MGIDERRHRYEIAASKFPTGNPWLDDALAGGINNENFMLVAAKTGTGKTFFGVQLATFAARAGKTVHYFALEAERNEIERRRKYYAISRLVHNNLPGIEMPRYREWLHMGPDNQWEAIEDEAVANMTEDESSLHVTYAHGVYTPEMFQQDAVSLLSSGHPPDLIILDHLHHFFLSGDEIEMLKTTIHQLKKIKDDLKIPVVVLAQLRKGDAGPSTKRSLPRLEDIRGTASLTDVATDVLIISQVSSEKSKELPPGISHPMYFYLAKSRTTPEAKQYVGIVGFDFRNGVFDSKYTVASVVGGEDPKLIEVGSKPRWAKRAVFPMAPAMDRSGDWRSDD